MHNILICIIISTDIYINSVLSINNLKYRKNINRFVCYCHGCEYTAPLEGVSSEEILALDIFFGKFMFPLCGKQKYSTVQV